MYYYQQQQNAVPPTATKQVCYSSSLLDAYGNFSPQKFVEAFLAAASREGLAYPHTSNPRNFGGAATPRLSAAAYADDAVSTDPSAQYYQHRADSSGYYPPQQHHEPQPQQHHEPQPQQHHEPQPQQHHEPQPQQHHELQPQQSWYAEEQQCQPPESSSPTTAAATGSAAASETSLQYQSYPFVSSEYPPQYHLPALSSSADQELEEISDVEESDIEESDEEIVVLPSPAAMALPSPAVKRLSPVSSQYAAPQSSYAGVATPGASTPGHSSSSRSRGSANVIRHRLKLVLDLDNTLLHACAKAKMGDCDIDLHDFVSPDGDAELYKFVLPKIMQQVYYVKFRPGLRRFLSELNEYCDLAIHTNATREYAEVIVAILDPDRSLFRGRVAAREDETARDHKKNMDRNSTAKRDANTADRLFGIDDLDPRSLVILDDRKDVWDNMYQSNIIHCGMYDYLDSRKAALIAKYAATQNTMNNSAAAVVSANSNNFSSGAAGTSGFTSNNITSGNDPFSSSHMKNEEEASGSAPLDDISGSNDSACWDTPFLDNPLVALSADNNSEDDDCEDGDLAPVDENGGDEILTSTPPTTAASSGNSPGGGAVGSTTDIAAKYYAAAAKLQNVEEQLIDFDEQLDWIRKLIIDVAVEYNKRKSSTSSAQLSSVNVWQQQQSTEEDASVVTLLAERRKAILMGVVIQTAGMYKSLSSHPEYGWHDNGPVHRRRLVALGADVVETTVPNLTHLLAIRATKSIDNVRHERGDEVKYVHALWLHACESTWSRIPEEWFQAMPLLKKYENSPPKKPWVDHWKILAVHGSSTTRRGGLPERLMAALELTISPQKNNGITTIQQTIERRHLVSASFSHGAQIWSHLEHVTLTFDPIPSSVLKMELIAATDSSVTDMSVTGPQRKKQRFEDRHDRWTDAAGEPDQPKYHQQRGNYSSRSSEVVCSSWGIIGADDLKNNNSTRNFSNRRMSGERSADGGFDDWSYPPSAAAVSSYAGGYQHR